MGTEGCIHDTAIIAPSAVLGAGATVGAHTVIGERVYIGDGAFIGCNVVIEAEARIGRSVRIDSNVIVREGTLIADDVEVGANSVVGQRPTKAKSSTLAPSGILPPLKLGEGCQIGVGAVIYAGSEIGSGSFVADGAQVREGCQIGRNVIVGHAATVENDCEIGDGTRIQTSAYITALSKLGKNVFIAPMVCTTNDNYMGRTEERFKYRKGVTVEDGGRIGGNAVVLPGVTIGKEAVVGAGSVVTRDVAPCKIVLGTPARVVKDVPPEQLIYSVESECRHREEPSVMQVPSFDLTRQNSKLRDELMAAIGEVVDSGQFILGDSVERLEEAIAEICGVKHAIAVANGSDALYLALMAAGVGPGDEVITTPFTFFATAGSIVRAGAKPVFCDIDPKTYNIDPTQIEEKITARTKAILPVHLYGQSADMDPINEIAAKYGLTVIEDAAQAIGAKYKGRPVGSLGDMACISFFPTKNLGAFGDAGMVVTSDDALAERLRMLRVHGSRKKYYHELLGINSRLDALQAAILNVKVKYLRGWIEARRSLAERYSRSFDLAGDVARCPVVSEGAYHVYHQYTIRVPNRDAVQEKLKSRGVGSTVYYPLPLHLQPVFENLGYTLGDFPESERAAEEVLSLPMFPELETCEQEYVVEQLCDILRSYASR
jgi:dTDP-4-amino-4,6-dideoxygalactose transaminase/acetyltransferase-like isoleucine patch superfamily enzyme